MEKLQPRLEWEKEVELCVCVCAYGVETSHICNFTAPGSMVFFLLLFFLNLELEKERQMEIDEETPQSWNFPRP